MLGWVTLPRWIRFALCEIDKARWQILLPGRGITVSHALGGEVGPIHWTGIGER
jgi:hypothetical protein